MTTTGRTGPRHRLDELRSPAGRRPFDSIVHVNEKGGRFGGTEEYLALVTAELNARGVSSHLVCGQTHDDATDWESVHQVDALASRTASPGAGSRLARLVGSLDADVIYLHNLFDPELITSLARIDRRGALLWYVHDHYPTCLTELRWRRDVGSCRKPLDRDCLTAIEDGLCVRRHRERTLGPAELAEREALARTLGAVDAVVVVSEYMRSLLLAAQPQLAHRIHLVPRPIRNVGRRPRRRRTRVVGEPVAITFAGRITQEKGLAVLLEALGAVSTGDQIELRVAGVVEDAEYRAACDLIQARAISRNPRLGVHWVGHLDYRATDLLLGESDIVAVPSLWPEPLGTVALEAMSSGAAVVASAVGGLGNCLVHGDSGLLVEPGNATAWTSAIESLLGRPDRAERLGRRARQRVAGLTARRHVETLATIVAGVRAR